MDLSKQDSPSIKFIELSETGCAIVFQQHHVHTYFILLAPQQHDNANCVFIHNMNKVMLLFNQLHLILYNISKLDPLITYFIAGVNSHSLTST